MAGVCHPPTLFFPCEVAGLELKKVFSLGPQLAIQKASPPHLQLPPLHFSLPSAPIRGSLGRGLKPLGGDFQRPTNFNAPQIAWKAGSRPILITPFSQSWPARNLVVLQPGEVRRGIWGAPSSWGEGGGVFMHFAPLTP